VSHDRFKDDILGAECTIHVRLTVTACEYRENCSRLHLCGNKTRPWVTVGDYYK